jgi:aromatic ring-opening dioxygenase catalytic subunit (LigB family)
MLFSGIGWNAWCAMRKMSRQYDLQLITLSLSEHSGISEFSSHQYFLQLLYVIVL